MWASACPQPPTLQRQREPSDTCPDTRVEAGWGPRPPGSQGVPRLRRWPSPKRSHTEAKDFVQAHGASEI